MPWGGLLALALTGFICVLTETIPAGLLPQISQSMGITASMTGQWVTLYALGSLLAAIPLTAATQHWNRKSLLLVCIIGFLLFNTTTAVSSVYAVTLVARFLAGVSAGVLWGMIAGYARRMVPDPLKGRAMAIAMSGTPLALALGVPIGTWAGVLMSWRYVFGALSLVTCLLIIWVMFKQPDYPGQTRQLKEPLIRVLRIRGILPILSVTFIWVLAHNILYTYIAPYLENASTVTRIDMVMLVFGLSSVAGIVVIAALIDRWSRTLMLTSILGFAVAALVLAFASQEAAVVYICVALWGLTFGGAATLLQTAMAEAANHHADVAQSMLVTAWNLAIGAGGFAGGLLLTHASITAFPWTVVALLLLGGIIAFSARTYGFPSQAKGLHQ
ncbi:MFS transporter [Paenibacillus tritici]|uniref:MFS transporter n=1 Tax=Paenibacillus tritici TaxID=1873425 RepID=UPI001BA65459|nr:MFS transporter [Paenibacillus tritici]QUL58376.1 MFS transporter [Paenibacillus tritici]